MKFGDKVVVLARPNMRGEITGMTKDGRLIIDFGDDQPWIFHPQDVELEQRDDLWDYVIKGDKK